MRDVEQEDVLAQRTPEDAEIPIPKRGEFLRNMEKVAPPVEPTDDCDDDASGVGGPRE